MLNEREATWVCFGLVLFALYFKLSANSPVQKLAGFVSLLAGVFIGLWLFSEQKIISYGTMTTGIYLVKLFSLPSEKRTET